MLPIPEENELIARAQSGDLQALNKILDQYEGMMIGSIADLYLPGGEFEDLMQVTRLAVWEAIRAYKPLAGTFPPFVSMMIRRRVLSAVKLSRRGKHRLLNDACSTDGGIPQTPNLNELSPCAYDVVQPEWRDTDPCRLVLSGFEYRDLKRALKTCSSQLEVGAILNLSQGYTLKEIAQRLGRSIKTIDNAITRVRRKSDQIRRITNES